MQQAEKVQQPNLQKNTHKANRRKLKARLYCGRFLKKTCMEQTKGKAADQTKEQFSL